MADIRNMNILDKALILTEIDKGAEQGRLARRFRNRNNFVEKKEG